MAETELDEAMIAAVVARFYGQARQDPELGPVFNAAVKDWDEHLARIGDFWTSVMLKSGRYKGDPLAAHMRHAEKLSPELFDRWLGLWTETTEALLPAPAARALQARAAAIAESLKLGLFFRLPG